MMTKLDYMVDHARISNYIDFHPRDDWAKRALLRLEARQNEEAHQRELEDPMSDEYRY